jgi:hypothetical protein
MEAADEGDDFHPSDPTNISDEKERLLVTKQLSSAASSTNMGKIGLKVRYYIALESTWHILLYAACWRYRPTVRVMESPRGRAMVARVGDVLTRWRWNTFSKMSSNVYNSQWKRALAEWTIINKISAPVSFPCKIYVAHVLAKRTERKADEARRAELAARPAGGA